MLLKLLFFMLNRDTIDKSNWDLHNCDGNNFLFYASKFNLGHQKFYSNFYTDCILY